MPLASSVGAAFFGFAGLGFFQRIAFVTAQGVHHHQWVEVGPDWQLTATPKCQHSSSPLRSHSLLKRDG